jgi:caspase domain-containing protein
MAKRAFIIAIENYKQMQEGLDSTLPNTHKHALLFRDWLTSTQGLAAADICFCTEDPATPGRTSDATRAAIKQELKRFKDFAKDTTDDMYFYFSGHGFSYVDVDDVPTADVLIAADYVRREDSGDACLKLDEIQKWLKMCLGSVTAPGLNRCGHYYFIDACRNKINESKIKVAPLGLTYDISGKKKAPVFTLCSTTVGAVAAVASGFPEALVDGLNGKGRAKRFFEGTFAVLFDSLRGYVERRLAIELDPRVEGGDGVIRKLDPGLENTCALTVKNAAAQDEFEVEVKNDLNQVVNTFTFTGPAENFKAPPDDYLVRVRVKPPADGVIEPSGPVPADLYDDCAVAYEKRPGATGAGVAGGGAGPGGAGAAETGRRGGTRAPKPTPPTTATVNVIVPAAAEVIVRSAKNKTDSLKASATLTLSPGTYTFETLDSRGSIVDRREMVMTPGDHLIDLSKGPDTPLRHALLGAIPHHQGAVDLSESLGPTPDQGMDLWLALIGGARIVGGHGDFSKLSPLPLTNFDAPGIDTAMYVLAGLEQPDASFRAVLSEDWRAKPVPVAPHKDFPGLFEIVAPKGSAGFRYLSAQVDQNAPVTVGVCSLPMRGTLVTLSQSRTGALQIQQFILPLRQFRNQLPEGSGLWVGGGDPELNDVSAPLGLIRRCVEVQRAFARGQELRAIMNAKELDFLLYFKWFEPIVALLAAYELVRRGEIAALPTVVANLRNFFKGLPDTEALAQLANLAPVMPAVPPLVLEGFQALNLMSDQPGLPPLESLVFRGPWTLWRGV